MTAEVRKFSKYKYSLIEQRMRTQVKSTKEQAKHFIGVAGSTKSQGDENRHRWLTGRLKL
jgi:hypothetical protein